MWCNIQSVCNASISHECTYSICLKRALLFTIFVFINLTAIFITFTYELMFIIYCVMGREQKAYTLKNWLHWFQHTKIWHSIFESSHLWPMANHSYIHLYMCVRQRYVWMHSLFGSIESLFMSALMVQTHALMVNGSRMMNALIQLSCSCVCLCMCVSVRLCLLLCMYQNL